jgi:hypothetical protein
LQLAPFFFKRTVLQGILISIEFIICIDIPIPSIANERWSGQSYFSLLLLAHLSLAKRFSLCGAQNAPKSGFSGSSCGGAVFVRHLARIRQKTAPKPVENPCQKTLKQRTQPPAGCGMHSHLSFPGHYPCTPPTLVFLKYISQQI